MSSISWIKEEEQKKKETGKNLKEVEGKDTNDIKYI